MNRCLIRVCSVVGIAGTTAILGAALPASAVADASDTLTSTPVQSGTETAPYTLVDGQALTSPAGGFRLVMQGDGNLVEYLTTAQRAVWSSRTTCATTSTFVWQQDNNAVVYCGNTPTFSTQTQTQTSSGAGFVGLGSDGNLLITGAKQWDNGVHVFEGVLGTITSTGGGAYEFVMQTDGNLVLYSRKGDGYLPLWSTQTQGNPGSTAIGQPDGNLVVYNAAGRAIWASQSFIDDVYTTFFVRVQQDGNVVMYQQESHTGPIRVAWQTGTAGRS